MNFNRLIRTAGIPITGGLYSGMTRDESETSFTGAFLRGTLLTGAGVALSKAGDPKFAKALSSVQGKRGMAARAAYLPAFLAHETMSWVSKNALQPTKSLAGKVGKGNFKDITGSEMAATAFTAYSAYEGAGILQSAGEADLGGVAIGAALFAAGKYAFMGGTYAAKAYAQRDEISKGYKAYKNSSAEEQDLIKMLASKTISLSSKKGVDATGDWVTKGTIRGKEDIMMEVGDIAIEVAGDPQYQKTVINLHKRNADRVMKASQKLFKSTYHGGH